MRRSLGLTLLLVLALGAGVTQASIILDELWSLAPGSRSYLTADHTQRGMAYNPLTGHILIVNRAGGVSINILDGKTGADLGKMDLSGVAGGTYALNLIGVADDGAIYAGNLSTSSTAPQFKLYRWANESAVPTVAYQGDPTPGDPQRWGDTLDVRGAGADTQVLIAPRGTSPMFGTKAQVLLTPDGSNFGPYSIATDAAAGDMGLGVTFGIGNSFWSKSSARPLRNLAVDVGTQTATTVASWGSSVFPASVTALDLDPTGTMLLGLHFQTDAKAMLYDVSNMANPPVLLAEGLLPTNNPNTNGTGSVKFGKDGIIYVLGTNNGIAAFAMIPEPGTLALLGVGAVLLAWRRRR